MQPSSVVLCRIIKRFQESFALEPINNSRENHYSFLVFHALVLLSYAVLTRYGSPMLLIFFLSHWKHFKICFLKILHVAANEMQNIRSEAMKCYVSRDRVAAQLKSLPLKDVFCHIRHLLPFMPHGIHHNINFTTYDGSTIVRHRVPRRGHGIKSSLYGVIHHFMTPL